MIAFLRLFLHVLISPFKTQVRLEAEIVLLHHQLNVLALYKPALCATSRLRRKLPSRSSVSRCARSCRDHVESR